MITITITPIHLALYALFGIALVVIFLKSGFPMSYLYGYEAYTLQHEKNLRLCLEETRKHYLESKGAIIKTIYSIILLFFYPIIYCAVFLTFLIALVSNSLAKAYTGR